MQRLIEGYRRFRETAYREHHALYEALVSQGQSPRAMIIGCSDSRVDPAILFGTEPGEVFVVRNVANLVPPYAQSGNYHGTSAALEFAVRSLQVEHVIVLGHARCGGIAALLNDFAGLGSDFIRPPVSAAISVANPLMPRQSPRFGVTPISNNQSSRFVSGSRKGVTDSTSRPAIVSISATLDGEMLMVTNSFSQLKVNFIK